MTPLHHIGEFCRNLLLQVPLPVVRGLFLLPLIALLIWVLRLPRAETTDPDRPLRLAENLKLWAALALLIQITIYALV